MNEEVVFKQVELMRQRTVDLLKQIDESTIDVIPQGYNNNIRWNLGHIWFTQERLIFAMAGLPPEVPESAENLFKNGSKPADWTEQPPTWAELERELSAQTQRIRAKWAGKLDAPLQNSFRGIETVGEMLIYSINHEATHTGYIMAMRKAMAAQS